jgi:cytochrome c556
MSWRSAVAAGLVIAALAPACRRPASLRYEERLEAAPPEVRHAIHNERLRERMLALERVWQERMPQALEPERERERRAAEVAEVARRVARAAEMLPSTIDDAQLDAEERSEFRRLAEQLASRADELAEDAARLPPDALRAHTDAILATCDACHQRFRLPPADGPS